MAQKIEQKQAYCTGCQRATLHQRNRYTVPHLGHLIFTLFLCLFGLIPGILWGMLWMLHVAVNTFSAQPYLCMTCGQPDSGAKAPPSAPAVASDHPVRVWTTRDGQHQTSARLVSVEGEQVVLQKVDDGAQVRVPLDRISDADAAWLDSIGMIQRA